MGCRHSELHARTQLAALSHNKVSYNQEEGRKVAE